LKFYSDINLKEKIVYFKQRISQWCKVEFK
jgi:hypothetical protein